MQPSTREQGSPGGMRPSYNPHSNSQGLVAFGFEENGMMQPPMSINVFDRMRSQDGEVESVLLAVAMAVAGADWSLHTQGVPESTADFVRSEIGMPKPGEAPARQRRHGINILDHVAEVANTLPWAGFAPFEQVYEIAPPNPGQASPTGADVVHLRKVAARDPRTIQQINTDRDGGLKSITQFPVVGHELVDIKADRLVMYTNRKEGANWWGRSVLRSSYKHWIAKDIFMRLDSQAVERNSMGVPVGTYSDPQHKMAMEEQLRNFRAGAQSYMLVPEGCSVQLMGVSGSTIDITPKIEYHDKQMARAALAMILNLGHDNGARSLGETFKDLFLDACQVIADHIGEIVTEHIIRDLVEFNYGEGAEYPVFSPGDLKASAGVDVDKLVALVGANIVRADDDLEDFVRGQYGLPERNTETAREAPASTTQQDTTVTASQDTIDGLDEMLVDLVQDHKARRGGS